MTNAPFAPPRSPNGGFRYPKTSRLLKPVDFRKVYDNGSRFSCPYFVAFLLRHSNESGPRTEGPRIGFTLPRAVGNAVVRNRIRRRLRELVRLRIVQIDPALDIVFNPRRAAFAAPGSQLAAHLDRLVERCRE
ncbi:MAG: ribonuclease P protein component [Acidobacteria bacterium]|nr:ribonuclease P protein component [Acidobacteriota bacterium]